MKDQYNIEMENIAAFRLERSQNYQDWEPVAYDDVCKALQTQTPEKCRAFFGVVRSGGCFLFQNCYYRIQAG